MAQRRRRARESSRVPGVRQDSAGPSPRSFRGRRRSCRRAPFGAGMSSLPGSRRFSRTGCRSVSRILAILAQPRDALSPHEVLRGTALVFPAVLGGSERDSFQPHSCSLGAAGSRKQREGLPKDFVFLQAERGLRRIFSSVRTGEFRSP